MKHVKPVTKRAATTDVSAILDFVVGFVSNLLDLVASLK